MQDERGLIEEARALGGGYFLLKIAAPLIAAAVRPGHFVMARVSPAMDPLLRRPLGILEGRPPYIWLYFQVLGSGTRLLSGLRHGDSLDLLGPLGNSFPEMPDKRVLLIAGGRGIVPLFHYARAYGERRPLVLLYGGRGKADLPLLERIKSLTLQRLFVFSEDGSLGQKGLLTDGLEKIVREERPDATLSCGPEAMLARLAGLLKGRGLNNLASLEARMGCGFGACHGCAVPTVSGAFRKVCDEGPVFPLEEIQWRT
ncbi:MAG: dihydroorotate dehydrogenase electron transfer subunit [Acidobacteria bacterium]|jgi:dihydroorotate dehydrogenase electron transfer subunit|nr:dihydroorotate dehydrogenase electron transfer subunit [Acidobacteriota bacterium]